MRIEFGSIKSEVASKRADWFFKHHQNHSSAREYAKEMYIHIYIYIYSNSSRTAATDENI